MNKNSKLIILGVYLISIFNTVYSQNVWESFGTSSSPWVISPDLKIISKSTYKVEFQNLTFQSEEEKKNKTWSAQLAYVNLTSYNETPLDIAFTVRNIIPSNLSNIYKDDGWYWYVSVDYTTTSGQDKYYKIIYHAYKNYSTISVSTNSNDNGVSSGWKKISPLDARRFRFLFDDNQFQIYNDRGDNLEKTLYGVKKIRYINIGIGPGTNLQITNTSCQKMTVYGQSLPYLQKAANYLDNNNASSAASEMTTAINKGLGCYETYLMRGIAYYKQGYYKSAIEDFTTAISYSANNKETAYYYRGMSKLAIGDDYGINDLRSGGQEGMVFLRENNLLNYTPGQKKTTPQKRNSSSQSKSSQPKKPVLKK